MLRLAPQCCALKFFKRKKEKKESHPSSGGFKKNKFFRKNTTRYIIGNVGVKSEVNVVAKRYGWRFLLKPVGLELFFLKPELTFTFFYLFFYFPLNRDVLDENGTKKG